MAGKEAGKGKAAKEKAKRAEKQDKLEPSKVNLHKKKALGRHSTEFEYTPAGGIA